ncbi:hypothetical protein NPIL_279371 [Nephila pilipes]|uniref:Uncharacterized protein n=1 Tax=Nephila pilipes TaxID=299642 RepID=A0A8X6MWC2_NEPPI|nr:hypothetical protein NPIL_279371 [Nephila pilipes]
MPRKWKSNSLEIRQLWKDPKFDISEEKNDTQGLDSPSKMLVLVWDPKASNISFNVKQLSKCVKNEMLQKDSFLKVVGYKFDPVRYLEPSFIKFKCIIRELCSHDLDKDVRLSFSLDHKEQL